MFKTKENLGPWRCTVILQQIGAEGPKAAYPTGEVLDLPSGNLHIATDHANLWWMVPPTLCSKFIRVQQGTRSSFSFERLKHQPEPPIQNHWPIFLCRIMVVYIHFSTKILQQLLNHHLQWGQLRLHRYIWLAKNHVHTGPTNRIKFKHLVSTVMSYDHWLNNLGFLLSGSNRKLSFAKDLFQILDLREGRKTWESSESETDQRRTFWGILVQVIFQFLTWKPCMIEWYLPRKDCDFSNSITLTLRHRSMKQFKLSGQHQVNSHQNQPITTVDFCHSTEILTNKLEETRLGCVTNPPTMTNCWPTQLNLI